MMIFQIYFSDLEVGRCKETSNLQKVGELIGVNMVLLDKKDKLPKSSTLLQQCLKVMRIIMKLVSRGRILSTSLMWS
ncbi:unnamed protein product [Brassica napus]|uniref:(rape) hypothetical protein n=1 Tax=Brassica napus TaxID=3708 RepID=A0A817B2M7_BRANA|nr:unnamed protein product [Brassica napus]